MQTIPKHMSGIVLTAHGGPDVLQWRDDLPVPSPKPNEVLVRVLAAGVNNTDINTRIGWYSSDVTGATDESPGAQGNASWSGAMTFPRIQGGDLCGRIVALGRDVATITPEISLNARVITPNVQANPTPQTPKASAVLGSDYDGAFAEYCVVPARHLYDVTDAPLSDIELAALPCAFGTAAALLTRARVASGHKVLITGASGGVGLAAVMLARIEGANVTAITAPEKADAVLAAGANTTLPRNAMLEPDSYDAVIDIVGGDGWADRIKALQIGGHYAIAGAIAGPIVETDLRDIYLRDITIAGSTFQAPETFARLVSQINAGSIHPLVSATFPLRDIAKAQQEFLSKRLPGKIVLTPSEIQ